MTADEAVRDGAGMTFATEDPVASGQTYLVTEVNGQPPNRLADFAGDVEVTLANGNSPITLAGEAAQVDGAVRLCQKERGPTHRDIRLWTVTEQDGGGFAAEPFAAF